MTFGREELLAIEKLKLRVKQLELDRTEPIAIVGASCRLPGCDSPEELWELLDLGRDPITSVDPPSPALPPTACGVVESIDEFDAEFFRMSPREVLRMDGRQRLVLETSWEALERAGIPTRELEGTAVGIYVGATGLSSLPGGEPDAHDITGALASVIAGRVSHFLGVRGPCMSIDTACSSSLVALHVACKALRARECSIALAGGVGVLSRDGREGESWAFLGHLARSGRCRTFDAAADGAVASDGCAMLVLKRLGAARRDGDRVLAVIRGSAVNHDGRAQGLTVPNGAAQEEVIRQALRDARVDPRRVDFVECHGTGTSLGDPIEAHALGGVFADGRDPDRPLVIGSIKSNLGHTDGAAGVAGLLKVLLALEHGRIPGNLHFETPSPHIAWDALPLRVAAGAVDWPRGDAPRLAGVSSFGVSGTNAHVVIEEAPAAAETAESAAAPERPAELVLLSARTPAALDDAAEQLRLHLDAHPELALGDVASSLATTRTHHEHRLALSVRTRADLGEALAAAARGETPAGAVRGEVHRGKLAWLFTGQGSQVPGMGRELAAAWPVFRDALDAALAALDPHMGIPLRDVLWAEPGTAAAAALHRTANTQPALFALEVALAALWRSWGVGPDFLIGHSIGELAAAHVAGVFSLEDAARLVVQRGRLMQRLPAGGAMVSIAAPAAAVAAAVEPHAETVSVAAVNGPGSVVIAGAEADVVRIADRFAAGGARTRRLEVSHAFHSPLMDAMLDDFRREAERVTYRAPSIPLVSNLDGALAGPELLTPDYWVRHVRRAVRFADGVSALSAAGVTRYIELGPRPTLLGLVPACLPADRSSASLFASLRPDRSEPEAALEALGGYHASGGAVDWTQVFPGGGRRVLLPTYPWQRQPCRREEGGVPARAGEATEHELLGVHVSLAGAETIYESVLSRRHQGWLYDHVVAGRAIMPGAGMVELVRAAGEHRLQESVEVASLILQAPLVLPGRGGQRVQVVLSQDGDRFDAAVYSQPEGPAEPDWTLHATAEVRRAPADGPGEIDLEGARARCREVGSTEQLYAAFGAMGLTQGPAFRGLQAVWGGDGEALAEVALPDGVTDADRYGVHPALLDAAFQATLLGAREAGGDDLWLPFAIDRLVVHVPGARRAIALVRRTTAPGGESLAFDVTLADPRGRVLVELGGLRARRADPAAMRAAEPEGLASARYRVDWPAAAPPDGALPPGRWILAARPEDPIARDLVARLEAMGASCVAVDIDGVEAALPAEQVVCVWPAGPGGADPDRVLGAATDGLALIQRLAGQADPPRLWWMTRGAVAVDEGEAPAVDGAALWGLARTVMQELPELRCTLVDASSRVEPGDDDWLVRELCAGDDEREVAWRGGIRRAARLVRVPADAATPRELRDDGAVVITGGLGALGLHVARWLAGRGARRLVLVGRRGADTPGAAAAIAELEALGASVSVAAVDAGDRAGLAELLRGVAAELPVRGIVHAAGVVDDGVIAEQRPERFARVFAPKVDGALHLDALSRELDLDLDFFVLFSSTAGTLGSAGQAPYAAANACLDALAARRRAEGLPAHSLAWGAWSDAGMAAELGGLHQSRMARQGARPLSAGQGIALLAWALGVERAQLVLLPLDLRAAGKAFDGVVPPIWRTLVRAPRRSAAADGAWARELEALPDGLRLEAVAEVVRAEIARVLALASPAEIAPERPLQELGLDSLMAVELRNALGKRAGGSLPATLAFDYPTPDAIARYLLDKVLARAGSGPRPATAASRSFDEPIAIVGMACRYPGGVTDLDALWRLLEAGGDGIIEVPPERWDVDALYDPDPEAAGKMITRSGGFLRGIDQFDPAFFGISPREAVNVDPQQRLLLETSWEALERAGIPPDQLDGTPTGVFVGLMYQEYASLAMAGGLDQLDGYVGMGTAASVAAGRLSYTLGLQGPCMTVDTACSSSLVTAHLACQALRQGECSLALAGGAAVMVLPAVFVEFSRLRGLAPDGRCKSFSEGADGVGWSEGCGMLVLERLSDARRNRHPVLALIRGSAVNQDGRSNGLTAPNGPSQEAVIRQALSRAGVQPSEVQYVECHGTGTPLGDPIEVQALGSVLAEGREPDQPAVIGSIKSNLGHTQAAAGAAGIMKVVLSMAHERIPRNIHFESPSPHIAWDELPVRVASEPVEWRRGAGRRIAGVSSFGVSGTNAHLILEEPPEDAGWAARPGARPRAAELVTLSARSAAALDQAAARLVAQVEARPDDALGDLAYSLATSRAHHEHRLAISVRTRDELVAALDQASRGEAPARGVRGEVRRGKTAWLFTGQGSQRPGMGRELAAEWPVFAEALEEVIAALDPHLPAPLGPVLWPEPGADAGLLDQTVYTQPALFAVEVALAALWRSWGVEPDWLMGHSIGEIAAAHVAGVFSLGDAARLVASRGLLMQGMSREGAMWSIAASEDEVAEAIAAHAGAVSIGGVNGPASVVIAGAEPTVSEIARAFADRGARTRRLEVSHAFHSPLMDGMLDELRRVAASIDLQPPRRRLISNVTGQAAGPEIQTAEYWVRHARDPVRFADGVGALHRAGVVRYVELGPRATLLGLVPACIAEAGPAPALVASLRADRPEVEAILEGLAGHHASGGAVDWRGVFPAGGRTLELPTYPWQHRRFWIAERAPGARAGESTEHPLLGTHVSLAGGGTVYESVLSRREQGWLYDHQVAGRALVPGAGLAELVRAAGEVRLEEPAEVESLVLRSPLVLPERGGQRVQVVLSDEAESCEASVYSQAERAAPGEPWILHARAQLRRAPASPPPAVDLAAVRGRCREEVPVPELYERLAAAGLPYGPAFRGLTRLWRGSSEALAELSLPDALEDTEDYGVHPALLDAAFHALAGLARSDRLELPFAIDRLIVHRAGARSALAHLRRNEAPDDGEGSSVDLTLTDPVGNVLVELIGLHGRPADPRAIHRASEEGVAQARFRIEWQPAQIPDEVRAVGRWLVVSDEGDPLARALAGRLVAEGATVASIEPARLDQELPAGQVVCVWSHADVRSTTTAALAVAQRLAAQPEPVRLWWVTRGAVAADATEAPAVSAAALWGLGRTVVQEHPELGCGLIDVVDGDPDRAAESVLRELGAADGEGEAAWREDRRFTPRLVRARPDPDAGRAQRRDGAVIITGGLGALGLRVARWLAQEGLSRPLVLVGRRGIETAGAAEAADQLRALGAEVIVAAADVSDRDQLGRVIGLIPPEIPLRGIVHAAGVLDDGILAEQTPERFDRVLGAKVDGAIHLDALTRELDLDFFALFSSVAGTLGSAGQAPYAAANAALDAVAAARRAAGLPGISLAWGAWSEAGMAAGLTSMHRARLSRQGIGVLSPDQALALLESAIGGDEAHLVLVPLDLRRVARAFGASVPPLWRKLVRAPRRAVAAEGSWAREVAALAPARRYDAVFEAVRIEIARVLALAGPGEVPAERPLQDLGLDSLMAVELRNALGKRAGATLSATLAFDYPTPAAIARHLLERALGLAGESAGSPAPAASPAAPTLTVEAMASLSDEEALARLQAELSGALDLS